MIILVSGIFIFLNYLNFMPFMVRSINSFEMVLAILTIIVVFEAARRTAGWAFPILAAAVLAYTLWGQYIPSYWGHPPLGLPNILTRIYLSPDAMWGFMTGLSATYIAMFVIFGSFLLASGAGQTFVDLAKCLAGKFIGGPAKVAVVSSGFFSMMSGSPMANVATTGSFTIPMMKKLGYSPEFAGGVEATASTGGILTPPIMGAAGFIMAEFLGIPYLKVIIAAAIPAFLFYVAAFMGIHFRAVKLNLKPVPREERPPLKSVLVPSRVIGVTLPVGVLLYMLIRGYSLTLVGTSACMAVLLTYIFSNLSQEGIKQRLRNMPHIFEKAGRAIIIIPPVLVSANIILFLLDFTGLNLKFSTFVLSLSGGYLITILLLVGILVMILGCGLPVTAAYVMGVTVAAPALIELGVLPLAAHLFILYYSIIAGITPPVCPTVYVAVALAKSNWLKTAWVAMRLAPLLYLMPFIFVFDNTFIMVGPPWAILLNVSAATIGAIVLSGGIMGQLVTKCSIPGRLVLLASGVLLLLPAGYWANLLGGALAAIILIKQLRQKKKVEKVSNIL